MDHDVAIIGGSFTGLSVLSELGIGAVVFTSESQLGVGTPFEPQKCGASIMSLNIAENEIQVLVGRLDRAGLIVKPSSSSPSLPPASISTHLVHIDDGLLSAGLLSRTETRPQGWNRVMGQWEHYQLQRVASDGDGNGAIAGVLREIGDQRVNQLVYNRTLVGLQRCEAGWRLHLRCTDAGDGEASDRPQEIIEVVCARIVVLALPVYTLSPLLHQLPPGTLSPEILDVCDRSHGRELPRFTTKFAALEDSRLQLALKNEFQRDFCSSESTHSGRQDHTVGVVERDLSHCKGDLLLIAMQPSQASVQAGSPGDVYVLHGRTFTSVHDKDSVEAFLAHWLALSHDQVSAGLQLASAPPARLSQSGPADLPLTPLRARGCVVADFDPVSRAGLVLAGDWCFGFGCVSNAISSGFKAALAVRQINDGTLRL